MATLLERRQLASLKTLQKRLAAAQKHITAKTEKLEEQLSPYRSEVTVVTQAIADFKAANPTLNFEEAEAEESAEASPGTQERSDDPETLKRAYTPGA
jgi:septal ring factor EnvC (AmiA/AmiB activator)